MLKKSSPEDRFKQFMKKQYYINKAVLNLVNQIDEELDIDSQLFGCGEIEELKSLINQQGELL